MKKTYYKTCEFCGSKLDPCEQCDCQKERTQTMKATEKIDNQNHALSITAEEIMELMLKGLVEVYEKDGEEAVKNLLHMEA